MDVKRIVEVISIIKKGKYLAYLVGGSTRDFLYQRDFEDVDIATNATIQFIKSTFEVIDTAGESVGSIKIKYKGVIMELTRFRKESYDGKSSFPKVSEYVKDAEVDAERRDFTINAIYLDLTNNEIVDPYNGVADLFSYKVKFIGDTKTRILEDPSRIIRGIRLARMMNFTIEDGSKQAMIDNSNEINRLTEGRLIKEVNKLIIDFGIERTKMYLKEFNIVLGEKYYGNE